MKKILNILLIIFIILVILFQIWLFQYNESIFITDLGIDKDKFGNFGSFFGGFLGTLIALFGAIYIYKSYENQKRLSQIDRINRMISNIENDINSIEYKDFKGINALYRFDKDHKKPENANSLINHLLFIVDSFNYTINFIEQSNTIDRETYLRRIHLLVFSKLIWPVYHSIYDKLYLDEKMNKKKLKEIDEYYLNKHPDSKFLIEEYKKLTKKTYNYLLDMKLVTKPNWSKKMIKILDSKE